MGPRINWTQEQPAPRQAIRMIHANFPRARNLGIYVCREIKGTNIKSAHAEGRALDIGIRADLPGEKIIGDQLFRVLIDSARKSGIDNVIWNHQIWSVSLGGPRPWVGHYKSGAAKNLTPIIFMWNGHGTGASCSDWTFWNSRSAWFARV
jgi:hypothetical protein